MARSRRYRSKSAMQKHVTADERQWGSSQTFFVHNLVDASAGFDDECIVKRFIISAGIMPDDSDDNYQPVFWQILQTQTNTEPVEGDMYEDNLTVAGGVFQPHSPLVYDHTITMRKLSGSCCWLALQCQSGFRGTPELSIYGQLHYIED